MMEVKHQDLAAGRWWTLTLAEQLGERGERSQPDAQVEDA